MGHEGISGGYMDSVQYTVCRQVSDIRWVPVVQRLGKVRTSSALRTSVDSARVRFGRTSGGGRSSGGSRGPGRPEFFGCPQIRFGGRWHGRPKGAGRPEPGSRRTSGPGRTSVRCSFGQLHLLVLVLGVLAILSMVFLLVPGHA